MIRAENLNGKIRNNLRARFQSMDLPNAEIKKLVKIIRGSVDWKTLPQVSSNKLFQDIKTFLEEEK